MTSFSTIRSVVVAALAVKCNQLRRWVGGHPKPHRTPRQVRQQPTTPHHLLTARQPSIWQHGTRFGPQPSECRGRAGASPLACVRLVPFPWLRPALPMSRSARRQVRWEQLYGADYTPGIDWVDARRCVQEWAKHPRLLSGLSSRGVRCLRHTGMPSKYMLTMHLAEPLLLRAGRCGQNKAPHRCMRCQLVGIIPQVSTCDRRAISDQLAAERALFYYRTGNPDFANKALEDLNKWRNAPWIFSSIRCHSKTPR